MFLKRLRPLKLSFNGSSVGQKIIADFTEAKLEDHWANAAFSPILLLW